MNYSKEDVNILTEEYTPKSVNEAMEPRESIRPETHDTVEIARVTATGSSTVVEQAALGRLKSEENKRAETP